MNKQTKTQTASTKVVTAPEILKGLNVYAKRKTRAAKLTIAIKKQKDYIKGLAEGKAKQSEQLVAVKQLIELVAARQVYLPKSQRITSLPTAQTILKDVLEVNPALAVSRPLKAEPSLTPVARKTPSPKATAKAEPKAKPTAKAEPKAKPTAKAVKQDDSLVNLTKSIADLAKSVSDLTAVVTANSKAIAELQKSPAPKAESKPKAQPKAEPKPTAKAEPKQTILKDFSALANCGLTFPTQSEQKPKADVQTELIAKMFSFA